MTQELERISALDEASQLGLLGGRVLEAVRLGMVATGLPASEVLANMRGVRLSRRRAEVVAFLERREADARVSGERRGATLQEWLPTSGLTIEGLADAAGIHYSTASEVYRGRRWPDSNTVVAILTVSGGAVSCWDADYFKTNRRVTSWMRQRAEKAA